MSVAPKLPNVETRSGSKAKDALKRTSALAKSPASKWSTSPAKCCFAASNALATDGGIERLLVLLAISGGETEF